MTNREIFLNHIAQTSDFPLSLEIEKANGIFLYDKNGKKIIDLISGIGVSNVGHHHPKIVEAIKNQVDKNLHLMVYGEFVQNPQTQLAEALIKTLPENLDCIYYVNSGSEAVEGALKLAKRYTGKSKIISCFNAYHGSTHGALSVSGNEILKRNFRPLLPGISHINFGKILDLELIDEQTAAVIIEPVQGEAGIMIADENYFKLLRKKCDETQTILIFDEIQCGFGRTGKFWAFEHYKIKPDILITGKAMGGGMPLGAFISSKKIMEVFKNNPILGHITTFGGHPVSCAASLAAINILHDENLIESVNEKAERFKQNLNHSKIKNKRNAGLMMAFEFENFEKLKPIIDKAIGLGVLTDWFLFNDKSMRIAPPLTIQNHEIDMACELILSALDA